MKKLKKYWNKPIKNRYLSGKETFNFGLFALGVSFLTCVINYVATISYIPLFYNISSLHGYIIIFISTLLNFIILPFLSNKMEKTNTKYGRYKPYILCTLPLYIVLIILVTWIPYFNNEINRIIYAYMTCVPLLVTNGFFYNMYQTMPNLITPNAQERMDIMTPIGLIMGIAPTILQIVAGPFRTYFINTGRPEYMAIRYLGIISVILGLICVLFLLKVKERTYKFKDEDKNISLKNSLKLLAKNKPLIILSTALILGSLSFFIIQFRTLIIQTRFSNDVRTALNISGIALSIIGLATAISVIMLPFLSRRMSKRNILILFTFISVLCNLFFVIVGYENIPVGKESIIIITILHFIISLNPYFMIIPIMLGDVADYQQYKTGKRLDGHIQNLIFTLPALMSQIFMILLFGIQKKIGFEPSNYSLNFISQNNTIVYSNVLQNTATRWFDIVSFISVISGLLMIIALLFYPLNNKTHDKISKSLKEKTDITNI